MIVMILAPGIGAFLIILSLFLFGVLAMDAMLARRRAVLFRLQGLTEGDAGRGPVAGVGDSSFFDEEASGGMARLRQWFTRSLAPAGGSKALRPAILVGLAAAAAAVFVLARLMALPVAMLVALLVAVAAGTKTIQFLAGRRTIRFLDHLPDAIDLIVRATRAGIPVTEAIHAAGQEVAEPVRSEFRRIADAAAIGVDLKDALREASQRVRLPDFDFLVVSLIVQRETGGQLAETLGNLSDLLRRRKEMRLKVKALTAEGRMSAKIVGALPFIAAGGIFVIDPGYVMLLVDDPLGNILLAAASGCLGLGLFVIGRMTREEA